MKSFVFFDAHTVHFTVRIWDAFSYETRKANDTALILVGSVLARLILIHSILNQILASIFFSFQSCATEQMLVQPFHKANWILSGCMGHIHARRSRQLTFCSFPWQLKFAYIYSKMLCQEPTIHFLLLFQRREIQKHIFKCL